MELPITPKPRPYEIHYNSTKFSPLLHRFSILRHSLGQIVAGFGISVKSWICKVVSVWSGAGLFRKGLLFAGSFDEFNRIEIWDFQTIFRGPAQTWGVAQIVALEILYNSRELTMGSYQTKSRDIVDLLKSRLRKILIDCLHMSFENLEKSSFFAKSLSEADTTLKTESFWSFLKIGV